MKIGIMGSYGKKNLGDELILKSLLESLQERKDASTINVMGLDKRKMKSDYPSINAFQIDIRKNFFDYIKFVLQSDVILIGGGGLLNDYFTMVDKIFVVSLLGKVFNKKIFLYSIGAGPINKKKSILKTKIIGNHLVSGIFVRDEFSKDYLKGEIGIKYPIKVVTDAAFLTPKRDVMKVKSEKKIIIVSIRDCQNLWPNYNNDFKETIESTIRKLMSNKIYTFRFILMDAFHDYKVTKDIYNRFSDQEKEKIEIVEINEVDDLLYEFEDAFFTIGMRLHANIISSLFSKPFISISYDSKVENFSVEMNNSENNIKLSDLSEKILLSKIKNVEENYENLVTNMEKNKISKNQKANSLLIDILESNK